MTIANSSGSFVSAPGPISAYVFRPTARIHKSFLAGGERDLLDRLCGRLPDWVTSDILTGVGVFGAIVTALGYVASNWRPGFLFLASFGLIINWFGDSLDGSLARFRSTERHSYGFFLDHSMDAVSNLIITVGLGLSPYVGMEAALFTLVGYLLLGLSVFLSSHVSGEFRLSFLGFGPTELRLVMVLFNVAMFLMGPVDLSIGGRIVSLHSMSVGTLGAVLIGLFLVNVYRTASNLARQGQRDAFSA
jgi:archaetidylinositol phosphate synthase